MRKISVVVLLSILAVSSSANALPIARDGEIIDSVGFGATDPILNEEQTENGISYITGGVGDEELAYIKAQEQNYNTRLLIKASNGEYMGEVSLQIVDAKGVQVLSVEDVGPFFYANLPVGKYSVTATSKKGDSKTTKIYPSTKPFKGNVHIILKD